MTVSLMSMLGGRVNLSAGASEKDEAGKVELQSEGGDAAFETIMAASEQKEISAADLRAFFASRGIEVDVVQQAAGGIDFAALNGQVQKLPSEVAVVVQEFLSGATTLVNAEVEGEVAADPEAALHDLIAQLPARELTAEELSEIVQATGIEPQVIFDALRNTPAASPNLAAAMVDDMGDAAADAGLPLPKPVAAAPVVDATAGEVVAEDAVTSQKSAQLPSLTAEQQQVIQKIVNVLQGASEQAEFPGEWLSRLAALSAAKHGAEKPAEKAAPTILSALPSVTAEAEVVLPVQVATVPVAKAVVNDNQPQQVAENSVQTQKNAKPAEAPAQNAVAVDVAPRAAVVEADVQVDAASPVFAKPAGDTATLTIVADSGAAKPAAPVTESAKTAAPVPQHTPEESPAEQVAVRFRQAVSNGDSSIQIKLKPLELGSVDVRIETAADGQSRVHVTAEKRDTLDMLQRDARALERALNDIGFKTDNSSLSFNLRGDDNQQHANGYADGNEQGKGQFSLDGGYAEDETHDDLPAAYDVSKAYSLTYNRGVDISV